MSEPNTTIANIGDLAKPVDTLIQKLADATGAVFQPWQIKRLAKAEAEAESIKALAALNREGLLRRTAERLLAEELKKQENVENIISKALPEISEDSKPEDIENDWLLSFFENAKLVSDEEMQGVWSRLLVGESSEPGSFSKRTLYTLASMSGKEANDFEKLCRFAWHGSDDKWLIFVDDLENPIYQEYAINHSFLSRLGEVGLIRYDNLLSYTLELDELPFTLSYGETHCTIKHANPSFRELRIGVVGLTQIGAEIASICAKCDADGFVDYAVERWQAQGWDVEVK